MNKRRLAFSFALVVVFITFVSGESVASLGCKVQNFGKKLQCRGVGLNRIPKTIHEGIVVA